MNGIVEKLIVLINNHKKGSSKVLKVSNEEYMELMVRDAKRNPILGGNSGYDSERECYIFADFEIRRAG